MARKASAIGYTIPGVLAAAAGIVAVGLLGAPIASDHHASGCFMTKSGDACVDLPDPTEYGCPAGDFQCMFDKKLNKQPPPSDG
ncbi:hypothetical protein ABW16_20505 [Mycolicibacter heraklionensis]|uniref:DUF3551 domain-containing protein n=1 Tax=Mycolicibacter heraklionensis TaxID=512402 RepID=A0ABR5FAI0_9MYCO|nr:hypothetical protein [Mycolicibacter heraklionensis]KLO26161.1 hypothetical protein ABW16_20505 [Mycolicibacter heraklionensis]